MKLTEREKWLMEQVAEGSLVNFWPYEDWLKENEQRLADEAPSNWIPVSERLPEIGVWVVGVHKNKRPFTCRWMVIKNDLYNGTACLDDDGLHRDPTHWQPIEPPTGEDE